jgi:DNA-binding sugar fermentation-stimulating protein
VVCSQIPTTKPTQKTCSHRIELAIHTNVLGNTVFVGINPKLAETIVEKALCHNRIQCLKHIQSYSRETTFLNSRFDFSGVDADGRQFVLEVKNVPLADVVDVTKKERKAIEKENRSIKNINNTMIAYFPDGYRKTLKEDEVVSERALKHIKELQELKQTSNNIRTILCFVIQREDVAQFQPSKIDAIYRTAVYEAWRAGVEVITLQTKWRINNKGTAICEYLSSCELPITMTDEYGPLPE